MVDKRSERDEPSIEDIVLQMSHRLGNSLHIIGGRVQLLVRKMPGDPYLERNLNIIATQVEKMSRTIEDLLQGVKQNNEGESLGP